MSQAIKTVFWLQDEFTSYSKTVTTQTVKQKKTSIVQLWTLTWTWHSKKSRLKSPLLVILSFSVEILQIFPLSLRWLCCFVPMAACQLCGVYSPSELTVSTIHVSSSTLSAISIVLLAAAGNSNALTLLPMVLTEWLFDFISEILVKNKEGKGDLSQSVMQVCVYALHSHLLAREVMYLSLRGAVLT